MRRWQGCTSSNHISRFFNKHPDAGQIYKWLPTSNVLLADEWANARNGGNQHQSKNGKKLLSLTCYNGRLGSLIGSLVLALVPTCSSSLSPVFLPCSIFLDASSLIFFWLRRTWQVLWRSPLSALVGQINVSVILTIITGDTSYYFVVKKEYISRGRLSTSSSYAALKTNKIHGFCDPRRSSIADNS